MKSTYYTVYCCRSTPSGPPNVVQLSVHLATTLLEVTVGFLEKALGVGLTPPILEQLGSAFMFSTLLPTTLAQLGPVACKQPKVIHSMYIELCSTYIQYVSTFSTIFSPLQQL